MRGFGRLGLAAALLLVALSGCELLDIRPRAIGVSNTELLIDRNEIVFPLFVWNTNPSISVLAINLDASKSWINLSSDFVTSTSPTNSSGPFDKKIINVSIDRAQLSLGTHEAEIVVDAIGVRPVKIKVRVIQDSDQRYGGINIDRPEVRFSSPYLVDIVFGLRDSQGQIMVGEPAQFFVRAREANQVVGEETGVHLKRTGARQLKTMLVLDYSQSMQERNRAIRQMEDAVIDIFLPALNDGAQVGVVEFHRDDRAPSVVSNFTTDRTRIEDRVRAIQDDVVQGFYSGSKLWDAVVTAALRFTQGDTIQEDRHIIVFTDGRDTSSVLNLDDVFAAIEIRQIRVTVVTFGRNANFADLSSLASISGGSLFTTDDVEQLADAVAELIAELQDRLVLRWATLRRADDRVRVGFDITFNGESDSFTSESRLSPNNISGNVLQGQLRFVPSVENSNTVFLRADYVPRFIEQFRIYLRSDINFLPSLVSFTDDGLVSNWMMRVVDDPVGGGKWIDLTSQSGPLPFATFGPMLRFDFANTIGGEQIPFNSVYVENDIYPSGQFFTVSGYGNTLPPGVAPLPDDLTWSEQNQTFLFQNALEPNVTVLSSGLQYTILSPAEGASPGLNDTVTINLRLSLINGAVLEDTFGAGSPETLVVNTLILGAREGIQLMNVGSRWKFFIPPGLAFGEQGTTGIPGGSVIILEVELLEIVDSSLLGS